MASTHPSSRFALREISLIVSLTCAFGAAHAQTAPALKDVVVSGSRSEQITDDLPASIDVITTEELESGQVRDIRDLVRDLPNVSVKRAPVRTTLAQSSTGADSNSGFNIRGREGNQVLMLIDGIRIPRSYAFSANSFGRDYLDIGLISRVELIRGPASALYGSDGMAGLVNFITHDPAYFLQGNKTLGGSATAGYSSDDKGLRLGATIAGRASDTVSWLLSGSASRAEGLDNMGSNNASNVNRTTPNPQKDNDRALLGKVVIRPNADQKHVLTVEHVEKESDVEVLSARAAAVVANSTLLFNTEQDMKRDRFSWNGEYRLSTTLADTVQTAVSYQQAKSQDYRREVRNAVVGPVRIRDTHYDEETWQVNLQAAKVLPVGAGWQQKLTYGLDYIRTDVQTLQDGLVPAAGEAFPLKRFPDSLETSKAAYLQTELISDRWSVTPGVRYDSFKLDASQTLYSPPASVPAASLSGSAVSPKLGILFRATPEWSVFGNYASGFKAPNAGQVNSYRESGSFPYYRTIPNPNLRPEKSKNFELGLRGRAGRLSLDAALFSGKYKDLIEENVVVVNGNMATPATALVYQTLNVSSARIRGFEVKGDFDWGVVGIGRLSTPFAYGQTSGKNNLTGKALNSVDPSKLNVGAKYTTAAWDLRADVTHYGSKSRSDIDAATPAAQFATPSATTLDLSGQWRIRKDFRLNVGLYNVTDEKYWNWTDVRGVAATSNILDAYTQPGRSVRVSVVKDF